MPGTIKAAHNGKWYNTDEYYTCTTAFQHCLWLYGPYSEKTANKLKGCVE